MPGTIFAGHIVNMRQVQIDIPPLAIMYTWEEPRKDGEVYTLSWFTNHKYELIAKHSADAYSLVDVIKDITYSCAH